jgi:hypothetical protein
VADEQVPAIARFLGARIQPDAGEWPMNRFPAIARFLGARIQPDAGKGAMKRFSAIARFLGAESGQALAEEGILLVTLLGIGAVGGLWLVKEHPLALHAIDTAVRSYLFMLSLPFP